MQRESTNEQISPRCFGGGKVDATDLKSVVPKGTCGFDSHSEHNINSKLTLKNMVAHLYYNDGKMKTVAIEKINTITSNGNGGICVMLNDGGCLYPKMLDISQH